MGIERKRWHDHVHLNDKKLYLNRYVSVHPDTLQCGG